MRSDLLAELASLTILLCAQEWRKTCVTRGSASCVLWVLTSSREGGGKMLPRLLTLVANKYLRPRPWLWCHTCQNSISAPYLSQWPLNAAVHRCCESLHYHKRVALSHAGRLDRLISKHRGLKARGKPWTGYHEATQLASYRSMRYCIRRKLEKNLIVWD